MLRSATHARSFRSFATILALSAITTLSIIAGAASTAAAADTLRVWFASESPEPPFASWRTAARSIQEAVDAADEGDVVVVKSDTTRTYGDSSLRCISDCSRPTRVSLRGVLFPKSGVSIEGEAGGPMPILSGGDSIRTVLWVDGTRNAAIRGLRLRDGGVLFDGTFDSTTVVRGCTIESCRQMEGAGMWIRGAAAPLIEGNLFESNATDTVEHHQNGGALSFVGSVPPKFPRIRGNIFRHNTAGKRGGAIRIKAASPIIEGNLFEGNRASTEGGAIVVHGGRPKIRRNVFVGNHAGGCGGAIATSPEFGFRSMDICGNVFERDSASAGGAIYLSHGGTHPAELEIIDNTFVDCRADSIGNILYVDGPQLETQHIYFNRNILLDRDGSAGAANGQAIALSDEGVGAPLDSVDCNLFWPEALHATLALGRSREREARSVVAMPQFQAGDPLFNILAGSSPCEPDASPCRAGIGARLGIGPFPRPARP
jgi:hypothetical protein